MAQDPKYGSSSAGFSDAIARMNAQEASSIQDLEAKKRKLAEGEVAEERATTGNTGARAGSVRAIQAQIEAVSGLQGALSRETAILNTNTAAWRRAAEARAQATAAARGEVGAIGGAPTGGAGGRYGATTVGFSDAIASAEGGAAAATQLEQKAAKLQQAEVAAAAATERRNTVKSQLERDELAKRQLDTIATRRAAEQTSIPILNQREALLGQRSLGRTLGADIVPYQQQGLPIGLRPVPGLQPKPPSYFEAGLGQLGPRAATEGEAEAIAVNNRLRTSLAGVAAEQQVVNLAWRQSVAESASASQALTRHGALSAEFIQSLARGEVTLQEFGGALTTTIGKFAGWAVAGGLVYGAFEALKQVVRGATETATGVAQLERAQIPGFTRQAAAEGIRRTAANTNVGIDEAAEAQFYAARAGFNRSLPESRHAGETAILAQKLDQVPIQEAARGLGAVRTAFGLNAQQIRQVFNELDVGQLKFNARLQQTLPYLGRSASAFATAGGSIKQLVAQIVEVTGAVPGGGGGGGSGSAATFFTREPGNLRRAAAQDQLRRYGFDPTAGIGDINEAIQNAAAKGVTPNGTKITHEVKYNLAEAVSGGPALAGRYGIQLIEAGTTGRAAEIRKALADSQGSAATDLKSRLGQFNEELSGVGHTFERVGSEIGASGITSVAEDFLAIAKKTGEGIAFIAQPLEGVGKTFESLPASLQDILVAGGAAAGLSRLGGFGLLERGSDKEYVRDAARTTSEGLARQRSAVERRAYDLESARGAEVEAVNAKARFAAKAGPELAVLPPGSERAKALAVEGGQYDERIAAARARSEGAQERLLASRQLQLKLEEDEAVINSRTLSAREKAIALRRSGLTVAPAGIAANAPLVGPRGEAVGTAAAAREGQLALFPLQEGLREGATQVKAEGDALGGSLAAASVQVEEASISLKDALIAAAVQIKDGAAVAVAGGSGLAGAKAGGAEILAGGAAGAGAIGSAIGKNLLKSFSIAFLGGAAAEIGGEAIGNITGSKRAGSFVGGVGQGAAYGAAVGTLIEPGIGTAIGAGLGAGAGLLDQLGVFGGGGKGDKLKNERLKFELKRQEEGAAANVASIEGQSLEFGKALEASVKDESEAAVKAREKVGAIIKNLGATVTTFGLGTPQGQEAQTDIGKTLAQAYLQQFKVGPANIGKASEAFQSSLAAAKAAAETTLKTELPFATTPGQRTHVTAQALSVFGPARREYAEQQAEVQQQLKAAEQKQAQDQAKLNAELNAPRGKGLKPTASPQITSALEQDANALASLRRTIDKIRVGKERFEHLLKVVENDVLEAEASEQKALLGAAFGHEEQRVGNNPAAKRKVQRNRIQEEDRTDTRIFHEGTPQAKERAQARKEERATQYEKLAEEETREHSETFDRRAAREIAHLPPGASQQAVNAIKQRAARDKLLFEKAHKGAFSPREIEEIETSEAEAGRSAESAGASEASAIAQARGSVRQAQDAGDAVAQARDAGVTAQELLGLAKNEAERLSAMAQVIAAANQLQQALQQRTAELGELTEARELNPLERDRTKLDTLHKQLGKAKGPDEKLKLRTQIQQTVNQQNQDRVSEFQDELKFLQTTEQIVPEQAAERIQKFLRQHKRLSKTTRRALEAEIFQDQNAANSTDFNVGTTRQPTLYDAKTLTGGRAGRSNVPTHVNFSEIHHPPQLHQTNHISIVVPGGHPGAVVAELERAFRVTTRSQLRTAGLA